MSLADKIANKLFTSALYGTKHGINKLLHGKERADEIRIKKYLERLHFNRKFSRYFAFAITLPFALLGLFSSRLWLFLALPVVWGLAYSLARVHCKNPYK